MEGRDAVGNVNADQGGIHPMKEKKDVFHSVEMVFWEGMRNVTVGGGAMMIANVELDGIQTNHHPAIRSVGMVFLHLVRIVR